MVFGLMLLFWVDNYGTDRICGAHGSFDGPE